jgi:hypothetical protein
VDAESALTARKRRWLQADGVDPCGPALPGNGAAADPPLAAAARARWPSRVEVCGAGAATLRRCRGVPTRGLDGRMAMGLGRVPPAATREKRERKTPPKTKHSRECDASERALLCLVGCCACACYKLGLTGGVHGVSWAGSGLRPPQHWVCLEDEREHNVDWTGLGPG